MTTLQDLLELLNGQYIEEVGTEAKNQAEEAGKDIVKSVINSKFKK